jgi:SWI/SNF-related matrix-associated actin-dependent regulator 1 of chromatin subfamily A
MTITYEPDTQTLAVRFSYNPDMVAKIRGLAEKHRFGSKWYPAEKCWRMRISALDELTQSFPSASVDEKARAAYAQYEQDKIAALAASRSISAQIDVPCNDGLKFRDYQLAAIKFMSQRSATLLADEAGVGKTPEILGLINYLPEIKNVLVVCPKTLCLNWEYESQRWLTRNLSIGIGDTKNIPSTNIVIFNYDSLKKHAQVETKSRKKPVLSEELERDWDLIVGDEIHKIKGRTQRTKVFLAVAKLAKRKVYATGSPIVNRPIELWNIVHDLDKKNWDNYFSFGMEFCDGKSNGFGQDFSGASNLTRLNEKLRSTVMLRREKKDVLPELPGKQRQVISLSSDGIESLIERQLELSENRKDLLARLKSLRATNFKSQIESLKQQADTGFAEMAKIRHDIGIAKLPQVIELLEDFVEETGKVVVWAHHKDVQDALAKHFTYSVKCTGRESETDRHKAVKQFQTDPSVNLFIGSIKAAGTGITLTASSTVVFAETDWVPGDLFQCEDRCDRYGQENKVLVIYPVVQNSLDARIAKRFVEKQEIIDEALN